MKAATVTLIDPGICWSGRLIAQDTVVIAAAVRFYLNPYVACTIRRACYVEHITESDLQGRAERS